MPAAFAVANSPLTSNGTIAVTGAGTTDQYIRGDGTLASFPSLTGYVPYTGATADVDLGTHDLTAERGTFTNNGSSDTLTVNHTSGSGYGIKVTKGGNNEALYVSKTSGSGNAMTVIGGRTSLVDLALSSVSNTAGDFLTLSGGVVHKRTAAQTLTDIGGQAALTNPVTGTGSAGQVAYWSSGSAITGESNLFWDATNDRLGIGTATPSEKLHVAGVGSVIALDTNGAVATNLISTVEDFKLSLRCLRGSSSEIKIGNNNLEFLTNTSVRMLMSSNGRLLIGTPPPAESTFTLDVSGTGRFSSDLTANSFIKSGGTSAQFLKADGSVDSTTYVPVGRTITINGTTQDLSANRTYNVGTVTSVTATAGTGISISGSPITSSGTLTITNTAPDQVVSLTASTGISISGTYPNFTITNTSPSSGGTVTSVTASSPLFSSGGATPNITIQQASGSQSGFLSSTDWSTFNNKQNALTNPVTGTGNTNYLSKFTSNGSTIGNSNLINDSSGNLGLGVTPSSWTLFSGVLELNGGPAIGGFANTTYFLQNSNFDSGFKYKTTGTAGRYELGGQHSWWIAPSGTAGNAITFAQAMTLFSSGNLAVGPTSDAGFKLDVNGTGRFSGMITVTGVSEYLRNIQTGTSAQAQTWFASDGTTRRAVFGFRSGGSDNFTLLNERNGSLLIGTNDATNLTIASTGAATFSSTLQTGGDISLMNASGDIHIRMKDSSGNADRVLLRQATTNDVYVGDIDTNNGRVIIRTNGNDSVTISSAGAVQINNISGSGNRIVIANSSNTLISAVIGSGLAFDGTTLTATGGSSGSISGSGTSGTIALFTGSTSIGNSVITQSSGNIIVAGKLNSTVSNNAVSFENTSITTGWNAVLRAVSTGGNFQLGLEGSTAGNRFTNSIAYATFLATYTTTPIQFATDNAHRMTITSGGNVLINTTSDNGNKLRVNGTIFSDSSVTATSFFESSDATLKTLVQDDYQAKGIDNVVAKLYIKNGKQELGYFAQDLEGILPSAVSKGSDGLLNLSYREVHTAKIASLENRIKELESQLKNN
jgi:hypothetical protein